MGNLTKLQTVKIGAITPNPFRNLDEWPTIRAKVDEIKASLEATGFWEGYMIVRPGSPKGYEQAFGHHRLVAMTELWGEDHEVTVTVKSLSDDEMFSMMVAENSETYGQRFYYAVMQPIASLLKAYGEGRISLNLLPPTTNKSSIRYAGVDENAPYTGLSVAQYLGWAVKEGASEQAPLRVKTAMGALDLIEKGAMRRQDIVHLSQGEVQTAVKAARARIRAETADIDSTLSVKQEALDKAEDEGDTNKAKTLAKELKRLEDEQEERAVKAGRSAVKEVVAAVTAPPASEALKAAAPTPKVATKHVKSATQTLYDLIARWEGLCLETDPKWVKTEPASAKAKASAREALLRLSERAKNRAEEIR